MRLVVDGPEPDRLAAAHDDVEAAVREPLEHREVACQASGLAHAGLVLEHDAERLGARQAARHELAIAGLEDVQRQQLSRQEDERQRKHGQIRKPRHRRSLSRGTGTII